MGRDLFDKVHKILQMHKTADAEPEDVYASLKSIMGKNKELRDLCFSLEMIVFKEE